MNHTLPPRTASRLIMALALGVALMGLLPGVAAAKKHSTCGDQVVADWYDDGRVSKIYPLQCYRDAIKSLPSDVIDYSNAKEEISRALAFAKQGKPDPGGKAHTTTTTATTSVRTTTTSTKTTTTKKPPKKPVTDKVETDSIPMDTSLVDTSGIDTGLIATETDTSGPSSVPVPLIVLGSLAVVLLAAGSAGYLRRRSRGGDDDDLLPPAPS